MSIRRQTFLLVAIVMTALLTIGGIALLFAVRSTLTAQFDDGLSARAGALQSLARFDGHAIDMDVAGEALPRYQPGSDAEFFIVWSRSPDGWRVVERSESLAGKNMAAGDAGPPSPGYRDRRLPDGRAGRELVIDFLPRTDTEEAEEMPEATGHDRDSVPQSRILVAQSRAELDRALGNITTWIVGVGATLIAACIVATQWAVRRGIAPLDQLSARVGSIGPGSLDQRLEVGSLPRELAPIAARINDLLSRVDQAFARERSFTSAASHELRTPISELRMLLEVGLSRPRTPEQWEKTASDGLAVLQRAQQLTETLLRIARNTPPDSLRESADVAAILREHAARALRLGGHDPGSLVIEAPDSLVAPIDPVVAASIIGNLIENALRHGDFSRERPIRCSVESADPGAIITITNQVANRIASELPDRAAPESQARPGFGVGLIVCKALADSAGAHLSHELDAGQTLRARLIIPLQPAPTFQK